MQLDALLFCGGVSLDDSCGSFCYTANRKLFPFFPDALIFACISSSTSYVQSEMQHFTCFVATWRRSISQAHLPNPFKNKIFSQKKIFAWQLYNFLPFCFHLVGAFQAVLDMDWNCILAVSFFAFWASQYTAQGKKAISLIV